MVQEWLGLLMAHPVALASWDKYLHNAITACAYAVLDGDEKNALSSKGKAEAFRELLALTQNSRQQEKQNGMVQTR